MPGERAAKRLDKPVVVKLSARDVDDARRLLSLLANSDVGDHLEPTSAPIAEHGPDPQALQREAILELANRRRRADIFGSRAIFGEPAWEMLLQLYVGVSGPRQTISGLARLANASKSGGQRWVDYLEGEGWVRRDVHPTDRRATFVELTDNGRRAIELYLSGTPARNK